MSATMEHLSPRQAEFLAMAAQGLSHKQIAFQCGLSAWTVTNTLNEARARLQADNVAHAITRSIAFGLLILDCDGTVSVPPEIQHFVVD